MPKIEYNQLIQENIVPMLFLEKKIQSSNEEPFLASQRSQTYSNSLKTSKRL